MLTEETNNNQAQAREHNQQAWHEQYQTIQTEGLVVHQHYQILAARPLIRKTILFGAGNEQEAALLKGSVQHARTQRVFLAADSSEVLFLVQNVYLDLLILDDELTPLSGMDLYRHLHRMKGLQVPPAIILSDNGMPLLVAELAPHSLMELEKPIEGEVLVKAIDQFLI